MFVPSKTFISIGLIATFALTAAPAFAAITIPNVTGASNSLDLDTTTATIFGGVAGESNVGRGNSGDCNNRVDNLSTCNNCYDNGGAGDARLIACNPSRILDTTRLQVTIVSDTVESGTPLITTTANTAIPVAVSPSTVAKGQAGTYTVTWLSICDALDEDNDYSGCEIDPGVALTGTLKVGIDKDGDGKLSGSEDDAKDVTFTVHKGFTDALGSDVSTMAEVDCSPEPEAFKGICRFDISPGDKKVHVRQLKAAANFPQSTGIKFSNVLFFFSTVDFTNITPISQYVSLPVESEDTTTFALSSDKISGLTNETLYYFKVAVQDQAGNIGFYTADTANKTCASTNYEPPCHTAVPGEVTGVLAEDLNCFIATATFGSPMAAQVQTFRAFRNRFLLTHTWGRIFVRGYYDFGPYAARAIAESELLRAASRVALFPLFVYAWLALRVGAFTALVICFMSLALLTFGSILILKSKHRRDRRARGHAA